MKPLGRRAFVTYGLPVERIVRFWKSYAHRYRFWYLLGILCLVATNLLTVAIPTFIQLAVDAIDTREGLNTAMRWALIVSAAGIGIMVVRTLSRTLFFNPGRTIEFRVKSDLFDRLLLLPKRYFDAVRPGDIISRGTNDANAMRALVGFGTLQLFNVTFTLLLTSARMLQLDPWLTLLCAGPLLIGALVMRYAVLKLWSLQYEFLAQLSTISDRILESYAGVTVLQSYGALSGSQARFEIENARLLDLGERILRIRTWVMPVLSVASQLCIVIVLYYGGLKVIGASLKAPTMTIGELTAFIAYITILATGLRAMGFLIGAVQRGYLGMGRIFEIIDEPEDRAPPVTPVPEVGAAGHSVSVRGLTFQYASADIPSLVDIDLEIAAGETIGVFGPTGSGKSTLLQLLARTYDPPLGSVRLSDVDALDIPIRDYWRSVAIVRQEPFLFSRSIKENIALAASPRDIDEGRLGAAVRDASIAHDITEFSEGLETVVGERGVTLSGGQRQRVALARSLYRPFDLLLLDDVMSAVDHSTEERLIEAIYKRTAGRSAVIVSHRASVLASADRIIVLESGRLVDEGTHTELIRRPGSYRDAWELQQAVEQLEVLGGPE